MSTQSFKEGRVESSYVSGSEGSEVSGQGDLSQAAWHIGQGPSGPGKPLPSQELA